MGLRRIVYVSGMNRFPLLPVLLAFACTGTTPEETGGDSAETDADTDSDTDTDTDTDTDVDPNLATVSGTLTLPDGSPADHYRVNVCRDVCRTVASDPTGAFLVEGIDPEVWSFYVLAYGESDYAAPYGPIELGVGETRTVDMQLMPVAGTAPLQVGNPSALGAFGTFTPSTAWADSLGEAVTDITYTDSAGPTQRTTDTINGEAVEGVVYLGEFEAEGEGVLNIARHELAQGTSRNVYIAELPEASGWTLLGTVVSQGEGAMMMGDIPVTHFTAIAVTIPAQ